MADAARALISKMVIDQDVVSALSAGVREHWFEDNDDRRVFQWILDYFGRYQKPPTVRALKLEFPTYRVIKTGEPYEYYTDRFRRQRQRALLMDTIIEVNELLDAEEIEGAHRRLQSGLQVVGTEVSSLSDLDLVSDWKDRLGRYEELRQLHNEGELTGITTGFPTFNGVTGGFQPQQFVLFAGQQKQCKSWMLIKSAMAAQEQNKKVLFVTFEMSREEQSARYDALACRLDANKLLQNALDDKDMLKLKRGLRTRTNLPPFVISADITATTTPSGLSGKIEEHQPDIIFIDGVYLMENEVGAEPMTPQAYTSLSRSLKRLAQRIEKPVVGSMQSLPSKMAKSGVVTIYSLAWSSSWGQDADIIYGVEKDPQGPLITMRIVAGRNVPPVEIGVTCDWSESVFDEYEGEVDEDDDQRYRRSPLKDRD